MNTQTLIGHLEKLGACAEALEWFDHKEREGITWDTCNIWQAYQAVPYNAWKWWFLFMLESRSVLPKDITYSLQKPEDITQEVLEKAWDDYWRHRV